MPIEFRTVTPLVPAGDDLTAAVAFYEGKLGFETTYKDPNMAIIRRGAVELLLVRNADRHLAEQTAFRIQVVRVDALYAEYQSSGIPAVDGAKLGTLDDKPWGTKEFAVIEPAGVCITFYERLS